MSDDQARSSEAERTMTMEKFIAAPRSKVWVAWVNPDTLPQWWGPDGFTCRTNRIDLRSGGEWVFDMIGPDGTVYPNHHLYIVVRPENLIEYKLLWGENGPEHAHSRITLEDVNSGTKIIMSMVFSSVAEYQEAAGFGAHELGLQTLGKLAKFVADTELGQSA